MSKSIKTGSLPAVKQSRGLRYGIIIDELSDLQGKIMTLVDATFSDIEQRKAQKDMLRSIIYTKMDDFRKYCYADQFNICVNQGNQFIDADAIILSEEQAKKLGLDTEKIKAEAEGVTVKGSK